MVMFFLIAAGSLYAHDLRTCSEKAKLAQTRASGAAVATAAQALQERRVTWRAWVVLRKPPTLVKPHTETVGGCSGVTCPLDFACRTRSAPRALPMALITPLHAAAPVRVAQPGTCGGCGLATAYACPHCSVAHFCTPGCLERSRDWHARECGTPYCKAVELPPWHQLDPRGCRLNALLRGGCRFSCGGRSTQLQPSPNHGLTPLQLPAELASWRACSRSW